ncbi:maleylpyruvate isomerase family mycothiol-dependent enzyme [Saccharopolyspora taberi]|uniref:Maleylpyruvate isomerase family mycothiol-dependent enzyme n=1 Tax=Saccharopolyspora taberi TaxID=60895 RepID=A0ABN3VFH5_9PSEU
MPVDHGRMLDLLAIEGQLLTAATHDAHEDLPVPGTPGRTVGQTVGNLGDLCEDALSWMGASEQTASRWGARRPDGGLSGLTGRFTARLADLLAEFGTRSPDEPCATWWPEDHSVGFWLRRMLHATTVHRVDVQVAAGVPMTSIDIAQAVDGIDEALRLWFGYRLPALGISATRSCSVAVSAGGRTWCASAKQRRLEARPAGSGAECEPVATATLGGEPDAVYLWLWGRLPDRAVEVEGDLDAIAQLWGLLRLATW